MAKEGKVLSQVHFKEGTTFKMREKDQTLVCGHCVEELKKVDKREYKCKSCNKIFKLVTNTYKVVEA